MRLTHCKTQNMARNSENVKNEKYTLQDLDQGKKIEKPGKEKHTLEDMKYGKKKGKREK